MSDRSPDRGAVAVDRGSSLAAGGDPGLVERRALDLRRAVDALAGLGGR
ncbi:MAG TPA: hypothetical protein VIV06_01955 [Candidatus Limnocylindrales bacterium]